MTGFATNAFVDVDAMIEESVIGQVVDSVPNQRFIVLIAGNNRGQSGAVGPYRGPIRLHDVRD